MFYIKKFHIRFFLKLIFRKKIENYSDSQKTTEQEDDIIAIRKCIRWCYKSNSFTRHLKYYFLCEMGLFPLHNCWVSWLLKFLKLKLDSQSRLTIPEFSGYHCRFNFSNLFFSGFFAAIQLLGKMTEYYFENIFIKTGAESEKFKENFFTLHYNYWIKRLIFPKLRNFQGKQDMQR